jgi:hypothetical protein
MNTDFEMWLGGEIKMNKSPRSMNFSPLALYTRSDKNTEICEKVRVDNIDRGIRTHKKKYGAPVDRMVKTCG